MKYYLAIDIGASSGRHIVGCLDNGELHTDEVYRFRNAVGNVDGHLAWDIDALFGEVKNGLKKAFARYPHIKSVSVDTWGVDYVLMRGDEPVYPCYSYRDGRTAAFIDEVHKIIPFDELYSRTGIQFQSFNTAYQLYCDLKRGRLDGVTDFLMIPEYICYMLTGVKAHEYTNATTTGLVNAATGTWDEYIIEKLGLPKHLFGRFFYPRTRVGKLKDDVAAEVGGQAEFVLCPSHDTASAVEGIPMKGDALFISSGTWSLLGAKIKSALTSEASRLANFTNEGGVGYIRYLKNIMGMWVVNRLRDELCPDMSFSDIVDGARRSKYDEKIDINDDVFLSPESMKAAFDSRVTTEPETVFDYFNCAFNGLARSYKIAIEELEQTVGKKYSELYIVGGGAKNGYLNALTEKFTDKKVIALPIEATAIGNLKSQTEADK